MPEKEKKKSQPTEDDEAASAAGRPAETRLAPFTSGFGLTGSVFDELFKPFDQLMQQPLFPNMRALFPEFASVRQPMLDIQDRGDHFSLTAELPGFTKDDVEVRVSPNGIELKAERSEQNKRQQPGKDWDGNHGTAYQRSSRSYFHQYLSLPEQANVEKVDGSMKNGILELRIPKKVQKRDDGVRRVDLN
jgi:HSP20 family protein